MKGSRVLSSKISLRVSGLWQARHVVLEAQPCPEDHVQLLELSAQRGQVWRSLLQMGYRLSRVPGARSVEMIELLIHYVSKFEACQAQKFAIEKRNAQLLSYHFQVWVNLVPVNELRESAIHIINECDIDMFDVLVSFNSLNKGTPMGQRCTEIGTYFCKSRAGLHDLRQ